MANQDYKTIMLKARTKYDVLISNKDRPLGSLCDEEQHVIALQAELHEVKDSVFDSCNNSRPSSSHQVAAGNANTPNTRHQRPRTLRTTQIKDDKSKMRHG